MLITVAVILPLLFFAFSLTLDLSAVSVEQGHIQQELDQAALRAYRFLPFQNEAKDAARTILQQRAPELYGTQGEYLDIKTSGSSIQIALQERPSQVASFLRYFAPQASGLLSVSAVSQVLGTPYDVFFAFDVSPSHGPPLLGPASLGWGNELDWPTATFFTGDFTVYKRDKPIPGRLATQQCANPLLTAVKRTVIRSYSYFSNFEDDQIGVGVYPGRAGQAIDVLRPVAQRGDFIGAAGSPEALFLDYRGDPRQDIYCALAAQSELASNNIKVPEMDSRLSHWTPPPGAPTFMVDPSTRVWNAEYEPFLTLPQAVSAVSVREEESPSFFELVRYSTFSLLAAKPQPLKLNVSAYRHKVAFLFSSQMPTFDGAPWKGDAGEISNSLDRITQFLNNKFSKEASFQSLTVYYVLVDNPWAAHFRSKSGLFEEMVAVMQEPLRAIEKQIQIRFLYFSSPEELQAKFIPALLAGERNPVLGG